MTKIGASVLAALCCAAWWPGGALAQPAAAGSAPSAEAFPPPPETEPEPLVDIEWNPAWRRASLWDGAVITGFGSIFLIEMLLIEPEGDPDWEGPILLDSAMRDLVRRESPKTRADIGAVSDLMMAGSLIHNLLVDNVIVTLMIHQEPDVAFQMAVMNAEAYAVALGVTSLVKRATGRARPYVAECELDPAYSESCDGQNEYRSFFSGHATTTAVGAGLLCAHHLNMPLYDNGPLDVGMCATGIALTMITGALRIASDNHWATDVAMGHAVGFASGYLIPTLFFYSPRDEPEERANRTALLPAISSESFGLRLVGML